MINAFVGFSFAIIYANFNLANFITVLSIQLGGRDSSFGTQTRYWLDGSGLGRRWGARFSSAVQTGSEAHPAS
jgi:hypothetical protein